MSKKATKKDMFNAIKAAMADNAEIVEFCEHEIEILEKKAEKAKERAAKKKAEGDALKDAVFAVLTEEMQTVADITEQIEGEDITVSKVVYRLNALVKDGKAVKEDVVIETSEGKKIKRKAYALA